MSAFEQLGLSAPILKAIEELGFETPSEIQAEAIPLLLSGSHDFIGLAQTGTGKTAAFGLPLIERIDPAKRYTQALILAPTRELGQQITRQLELFSKHLPKVNVLAVYGGASIVGQMKDLRNSPQHIIVATPGRLLDLIRRKAIKLGQIEYVVLDEADEMVNMGFKEDLDQILSFTPEEKATWLFSATLPPEIEHIVQTYMEDPSEVRLNSKQEVNANIEHQYVVIDRANKIEALVRFLDVHPDMRGLVFCRTRAQTQELAEELMNRQYQADALHGDLSQALRDKVMRRFRDHQLQVLIATDVAARGIDVNDLTHVFHFNLPDDFAYYTHRSGRTARAGKQGVSIAFISGRERYKIKHLGKRLGIEFTQRMIPKAEEVHHVRMRRWCHKVLNQRTKGKLSPELLEEVSMLFGNLSKEEVIAKLLILEMEKLTNRSTNDLNQPPPRKPRPKREFQKRDFKKSHRKNRSEDPYDRKKKKERQKGHSDKPKGKGRKKGGDAPSGKAFYENVYRPEKPKKGK